MVDKGKLLIVQVAALGRALLESHGVTRLADMPVRFAESVFPAVTCTVSASFRTASPPACHGMIANGLYYRNLHRPMFWEQSADLVSGRRIWSGFRSAGRRVGMMFWQQSLGEDVDLVLSPAPIHKHHGGMIQDCYCKPAGLYSRLCEMVGGKFNLARYWGPLASDKVGEWIVSATSTAMATPDMACDLMMVYLPSLDYNLQRFGPAHERSSAALARTIAQIDRLAAAARKSGYDTVIFGDYAMRDLAAGDAAVFPNRALLDAGLMKTRSIRGMLYPDFHASRAFAMVDHEIAHIYIKDPADIEPTGAILAGHPGIAQVLDRPAQAKIGLDHANSGELVAVAAQGRWLAYPWWSQPKSAPDYAAHIDIHNKPGYDPCEMFFGWPPMNVSRDTARVRGSHGLAGPRRQIAWAASVDLGQPANLIELAQAVERRLDT